MSTETATAEPTVRLGISVGPFSRLVGVFATIGIGLGVAGFLIGHSGQGQIARQSLGMMMFAIIPFVGIAAITILGIAMTDQFADARTAALTLGVAGAVGHLLMFMVAMPFVMAQPIDPPIPEVAMMHVWVRATIATALAGVLVGIVGEKL